MAAMLLLAALGAALGVLVLRQMGGVFLYQGFMPEALMAACGRGFRHPLALNPAMMAFLWDRTLPAFDCADLPPGPGGPPGLFHLVQRSLSWGTALSWRLAGITQMGLWPLAALLGAAQGAAALLAARLFLPRLAALPVALLVLLSPVALGMMFMLRDFSKAPFFLAVVAGLVLAARARGWRPLLLAAGGVGAFAGAGFGLRQDLGLFLWLGPAFLLAAVAGGWRRRLAAAAAMACAMLLLAAPQLLVGNAGNAGSPALQGATEPFRAFLALRPAPYALGHAYRDELTLSAIAAVERPLRPGWDADEPAPAYGFSQAMALSGGHLLRAAALVPADFAAQALKATGWILGFPALADPGRGVADPGGPLRLPISAVRWQEGLWSTLAQPWMPALGLLGMLALLARVAARSGREALALAGLLLVMAGITGTQFSLRHAFHLEILFWLALASLPVAALEWRRLRPVLPRVALAAAGALGLAALAYLALAQWQEAALRRAFAALLAAPRTPLALQAEPLEGGTLFRLPVPEAQRAVVEGPPDSMQAGRVLLAIQNEVRAGGERLLLRLSGPGCPAAPVPLRLRYDTRPDVWQPLDQPAEAAPGEELVFLALYRATQNFAGVWLPAGHEGCAPQLWRLPLDRALPAALTLRLAPGWEAGPLRKGLGRFPVRP